MPALSTGRAAVLVVVGLASVGLVAGLVVRDDGDHVVSEGPDAAHRFLDAWERSREATWLVEADFLRTAPSGVQRGEHLTIAQRPPSRLAVDSDSISGLLGPDRVACTIDPAGPVDCERNPARRGYRSDVDQQLDTLRPYVLESPALYVVQARDDPDLGHCFELSLARDLPAPPLGTLAIYCFDPDTGAPTLTRIERPEAVDVTRTTRLAATVSDTDLDPGTYDHSP